MLLRRICLTPFGCGIPTEAVLEEMRASDPPVFYLVGTPKARLKKYEADLLAQPWKNVREGVEVKLHDEEGELYVFAQSRDRVAKERAMRLRLRQLRSLLRRLRELEDMKLSAKNLLLKLGEAKAKHHAAWRLIDFELPDARSHETHAAFTWRLNRQKLHLVRRREGRYLLRTNLCGKEPAELWSFYMQLVEVEAAFKNLKDDLHLRPIYPQLQERIEVHIFIAFLALMPSPPGSGTLRAACGSLSRGFRRRSALPARHPARPSAAAGGRTHRACRPR